MKGTFKLSGIFLLIAIIGFSFAACDDGGGTGTGGGGTTNVPVSGVTLNKSSISLTVGDTETLTATVAPNDATNKAVTWSTSNAVAATVAKGVVTAVATGSAVITVTAADGGKTATCSVTVTGGGDNNTDGGTDSGTDDSGKTYALGDTGPGGGKIFYYSEEGFTMTDNNQVCHYLEASPEDLSDKNGYKTFMWMYNFSNDSFPNVSGTDSRIGAGRNNTAIIIAADKESTAEAARACKNYKGGGKTDWFLPSLGELGQLYKNRLSVDPTNWGDNMMLGRTLEYWSSEQYGISLALYKSFSTKGLNDKDNKFSSKRVRAVRAF